MTHVAKARPAETTGAGLGVAGIIYGLSAHNWAAAAIALVGVVPAAVTYLVENGGLDGLLNAVWKGRKS